MNYLILIAIGLSLIFLLWLSRKKSIPAESPKIDKAKDEVEEEKEKDAVKKKEKKNQIATAIVVYLIVFTAIGMLFPAMWKHYWSDKIFFFISHICFISIITLELVELINKKSGKYESGYKIEYKRFSQVVILLIVIAAGFYRLPNWKKGDDSSGTGQESHYGQVQTEKGSVIKVIDTPELVRYKVKAVWGKRVKIGTPSGFKYVEHDWDPAYESIGNNGRLYWIRLNEDNGQIATEGLLNGKMTLASFSKPARRIELESFCILLDRQGNPILNEHRQTTRLPVYLTVDYTKE